MRIHLYQERKPAPFSTASLFLTLVCFQRWSNFSRRALNAIFYTNEHSDAIYSIHRQTHLCPVFIHTLLITGYSPVLPARDTETRNVEEKVNQATNTKRQQH